MDQDFKDELDSVVNALRKNGPLKNLSAMQSFCWKHKQAQMSPESGKDYYGFRVDTPKRRYYLRFLPLRGNYNFYIYCYQTDKLGQFDCVIVLPEAHAGRHGRGALRGFLHLGNRKSRGRVRALCFLDGLHLLPLGGNDRGHETQL